MWERVAGAIIATGFAISCYTVMPLPSVSLETIQLARLLVPRSVEEGMAAFVSLILVFASGSFPFSILWPTLAGVVIGGFFGGLLYRKAEATRARPPKNALGVAFTMLGIAFFWLLLAGLIGSYFVLSSESRPLFDQALRVTNTSIILNELVAFSTRTWLFVILYATVLASVLCFFGGIAGSIFGSLIIRRENVSRARPSMQQPTSRLIPSGRVESRVDTDFVESANREFEEALLALGNFDIEKARQHAVRSKSLRERS